MEKLTDLIDRAKISHEFTKSELIAILKDESINDYLFSAADEVRKKYVGDEIYLRALIEFTNICRCNCFYCGLRSANKNAERYRLSKEEILSCAKHAVESGYKTIVMQGGEDMYFTGDKLAEIVSEIHKMGVAITLSLGERTFEEYKILKNAGADRFLLRIETTDKDLYEKFHPEQSVDDRKKCLFDLKELGFETGTGSLVGLPGQTVEMLAEDLLFYKELDADMIGIGPLITHPDTPLKNDKNGDFTLALKMMALTRLILPNINIPATTAMETLSPNGRIKALQSGANVVMPNVTENAYRKNYEIYPGKVSVDYDELEKKLKDIGRTISTSRGFRSDNCPLTLPSTLGCASDYRLTKLPRCLFALHPNGRGGRTALAKILRPNMTKQELKFWGLVRNSKLNKLKFKRQYPIGKYIVDFVCIEKMHIVEIDGGGHYSPIQIRNDLERTKYLNSRGFKVIRFSNIEIDNDINGVIEYLLKNI